MPIRAFRNVQMRPASALAAAILCVLLAAPASADKEAGHVARLEGTAEATSGGANRSLAAKAAVYVAETVRTGADSRLGLRLGERTSLNLGAATQIRIEQYLLDAGGTIELASGTILYDHTGRKKSRPLEIRTPYGLIAVRGTRFYAGPSDGAFGVLVGSGSVVVTSGGKSVVVRAQQGIEIKAPGMPPSTPRPWQLKRIRAIQAAVR